MQPEQHKAPIRPPKNRPGNYAPPTQVEMERHEQSKREFPEIRLSAGEYVIEAVRRHPIGIVSIWAVAGLIMLCTLAVLPFYVIAQPTIAQMFMVEVAQMPKPEVVLFPLLIICGFIALGGFIATIVYNNNRFYLTNESVIQHVQYSLFKNKQQTVNLINVEDASGAQDNILQQLLGYGTLRLSTQGEETIYHFRFVANPKKVASDVTDAMEIAVRRMEGGYPVSEY